MAEPMKAGDKFLVDNEALLAEMQGRIVIVDLEGHGRIEAKVVEVGPMRSTLQATKPEGKRT